MLPNSPVEWHPVPHQSGDCNYLQAFRSLVKNSQGKHVSDWLLDLSPREEMVLHHVLAHNLGDKKSNIHGHQYKVPLGNDKDIRHFHNHLKKHGKAETAHQLAASGWVGALGKVAKTGSKMLMNGGKKVVKALGKYGKKAFSTVKNFVISNKTLLKNVAQGTGQAMQLAVPILAQAGVFDPTTSMVLGALGQGLGGSDDSENPETEKAGSFWT